jgi:hypothetical protein
MVMPSQITRADARARGLKFYYIDPCDHGHESVRYVSNGVCKACRDRQYLENRQSKIDKAARWSSENKDKRRVIANAYSNRNRDKLNAWLKANPDKRKKSANDWVKRNRAYATFNTATYRARKKQATPCWANLKKIREIYRLCVSISKKTGVKHHVDHVIPLVSDEVCGLHVENNLVVVPAAVNQRKSNKLVK